MTAMPTSLHPLALASLLVLAGCEVTWSGQTAEDLDNAANEAPTLVLDSPVSGASYPSDTTVPFTGTVTDDQDLAEIYLTITSNVDGLIDRPELASDGTFSTEGLLTDGSHEITVTATDGGGLQASVAAAIQIGGGTGGAPTLSVTLEPDPPMGKEWLACVIEAEDPAGLAVEITSNWIINGTDHGSAEDELGMLFRDDEVTCRVTATSAGGSTTDEASGVVVNSPPEVDEIRVDGAPADENGRLACSGRYADYDDDPENMVFEWLVNDLPVLTGQTSIDGANFDRDDSVVCRITPNDGFEDGEPALSEPVIIDNTAPTAPSGVTVAPESVSAGSAASCNVDSLGTDIDPNDTLVGDYRWFVDGVEQTGSSAGSFSTGGLTEGAVITCSARTSDGDLTSAWVDSDNQAVVEAGLSGTFDPTDAWTTISGTTNGDRLGRALAEVGDLDGDGVVEVALGANQHDSNRGRVFLFDGATVAAGGSLDDTDALVDWTGPDQGALFAGGEAIVGAGDVTGGGDPDLLAAAYRADDIGAAYLFAGEDLGSWSSGAAESEAALVFRGDASGDDFALDVGAADLDGDGIAEVLVGAPYSDDNGESAGAVSVYLGAGLPASGDVAVSAADHLWTGETGGDLVGYAAMEPIGDVTGDGYGDFSVGARDARNGSSQQSGVLYLLSGDDFVTGSHPTSGTLAAAAFAAIEGETGGDQLGMAAAGLGDLDGDGADDFAVGARYADIQTTDAGGVYVFFGGALAGSVSASSADGEFGSSSGSDLAGKNLAAGDVDGDGVTDLLVSSHYHDSNGSNNGTAWLLLGGSWSAWGPGGTLSGSAPVTFEGDSNNDYLSSMSDIVDLDADGADELIIGADNDNSSRGTVYVFKLQ